MHRQGMDTRVAERIREQQRLAAELRIRRLVELRQLERERLEVDQSLRDVSRDLAAAERDRVEHRPSPNLDDIRRKAREEWLALRAERLAQEQSGAATLQKDPEKTLNPEHQSSPDELQRRGIERWLEYRRAQESGRSNDSDKAHQPERDEHRLKPHELDRDYGPDDDLSM